MSKRIKYTNEPIRAEVVPDFLLAPEQLVVNEEDVKITISLSRRSIDFFKAAAERNRTSYQRMIRRLLDTYAERYRGDVKPRRTRAPKRRAAQRERLRVK
jgi:hypothetical protein